jgi:hypothetical protein
MRIKSSKRMYPIVLKYENGVTRTVKVRAASREVAEDRALKRNRTAIGVHRNA